MPVAAARAVAPSTDLALRRAPPEWDSVSSQRDTEKTLLAREREELVRFPDAELAELALLHQAKGISPGTARLVAEELTANDPYGAHFDVELGIDPHDLTNPWHAAAASAGAFVLGSLLPLLAVLLPPAGARVAVTVVVVLLALALTGAISAPLGGSPRAAAVTRLVLGGAVAMAVTYGIGLLVGAAGP